MDWRTSSWCNGGSCVEVASVDGVAVLVRDSTSPGGAVLALTPDAWRDLTERVRDLEGAP